MQKIFYEKEIDLLHQLKELVSLTVDESIDYKMKIMVLERWGVLLLKENILVKKKDIF